MPPTILGDDAERKVVRMDEATRKDHTQHSMINIRHAEVFLRRKFRLALLDSPRLLVVVLAQWLSRVLVPLDDCRPGQAAASKEKTGSKEHLGSMLPRNTKEHLEPVRVIQ